VSAAADVRPAGVDGWLTADQAAMLADAAVRCPPGGTIVEIGSFRGLSTIVLAEHAPEGATVVAIDPHAGNDRGPQELRGYADAAAQDRAAFGRNLARAGVTDRVRHVAAFSSDAHGVVDGTVDVLYVDGAHRYGPARDDLRDWGRRVADRGELLVHDAFSSVGVTLAILRTLVVGGRFRYVGRSRSLARYCADLDGSATARLHNAAVQLAQLGWFARNVAVKLLIVLGGSRLFPRLEWPY
jgi:hypothetical protein